jgi:hypothetical protein
VIKVFLFEQFYYTKAGRVSMKTNEVKTMVNTVKEMNESYVDLLQSVKGTIREAKSTRQLWRDGNEPRLIKIGLTFIVFPEPTPISETVGTCLLAAGVVQKGIRSRAIYVEDLYKTFQDVFEDLRTTKYNLRI